MEGSVSVSQMFKKYVDLRCFIIFFSMLLNLTDRTNFLINWETGSADFV